MSETAATDAKGSPTKNRGSDASHGNRASDAKEPLFDTRDISVPFASMMKLWQGEMERMFQETEKGLGKTWELSRKVLEEQSRVAEAQLQATQSAMRAFSDGVSRLAQAGGASR